MNKRLFSLDIFRGTTILAMILVNNPGSWSYIYPPLKHASWHGCTPADLIFPFFLFIVGVAICLSLQKTKDEPQKHGTVILSAFKRSLILMGIGLFLNAFPDFNFHTVRIPGVLQRIGVVFFICVFLFLKTTWKTQAFIASFILVAYWLIHLYIPVPGGEVYSLSPTENLAAWIDRELLGQHLWSVTGSYDPEGILSTIPAIVTCLIGLLVGQWLMSMANNGRKVLYLIVTGSLFIILGLLWNTVFPINKTLWTSSFVLYTGGIALVCFAVLFYLLDVRKFNVETAVLPLKIFGVNAISAYVIAEVLSALSYAFTFPADGNEITPKAYVSNALLNIFENPYNASLLYASLMVLIVFIPLWIMYRRNLFLKV